MSAAVDILTGNLLSVSWQVSILIGIIWLVSLFAKKASAEFRYLLWCIVLVRLCIPVGINLPFLPSFGNVDLINQQYSTNSTEPVIEQPEIVNNSQNSVYTTSSIKVTPEINKFKSNKIDYRLIAILLWLSGGALITAITIRRNFILHLKLKKCHAVNRDDLNNFLTTLCRQMSIKQNVSLHYMDPLVFSGPVTSGLIKHKIFLPPDIADTWPVVEIEPILLHELSHIKRHDSIVNFVQMFVQIIYFFHPLVWLVNSRINTIREEACDDMAIGYLEGETDRYSISILNVIGFMKNEKSYGLAGFGFAEMKNSLSRRLRRIMNNNYRVNQKLSFLSIMGLVLIGFISIAVAGEGISKKENLKDIVRKLKIQEKSVENIKGTVTREYQVFDISSGESIPLKNKFDAVNGTVITYGKKEIFKVVLKGNKIKADIATTEFLPNGKEYTSNEIQASNLIRTEILRKSNPDGIGLTKMNGAIYPYDTIYQQIRDPRYWGLYVVGSPLSKIIDGTDDNLKLSDFSYIGEYKRENESCSVFTGIISATGDSIEIWASQKNNYLPIFVEIKGYVQTERIITNYKKYEHNIFFPSHIRYEKYKKDNSKLLLTNCVELSVHDDFILCNDKEIDDSEFEIDFPKGTIILDQTTKKAYRKN